MTAEDHVLAADDDSADVDLELKELHRLLDAQTYVLSGSWKVELPSNRVFWSPENHFIYGTDPQTFVPTPSRIFELTHPGDRHHMEALAKAWRTDGKPFATLSRIVRPTGEVRVIEVRGWVEQDGDGIALGAQGTATDVTQVVADRREREALSEQRDVILRAAGDAICGVDRDGRITFSNPALLELLGRPESEVGGARLHDLVHRDASGIESHADALCAYTLQGAEPRRATDADFRRADGTLLEVTYVGVVVANDRFDGTVLSLRDVTEPRETARRLSESLEQIKGLSAQRGALLKDLVAAEENERSRIAADLHDDTVQTLSAVSLQLARATAEAQDEDAGTALARAEHHVRAATMRMRFLLFELLPPVTETDLRTAVATYCELLFAEAGIAYEVCGDPQDVPIDCYLLAYRLIQEALRNVMKHSKGTRAQISIESDGVQLTTRVYDDGVGFGPDASALGMRAGLRIVRQRAQAAGGSAEIGTSALWGGASITLRLPLRSDEPQTMTPAARRSPGRRRDQAA